MMPSLAHCQNCACVVQNCLRSRQITNAVFFLRRFFLSFSFFIAIYSLPPEKTPLPLHVLPISNAEVATHSTPWGSLSCEAASDCQKFRIQASLARKQAKA